MTDAVTPAPSGRWWRIGAGPAALVAAGLGLAAITLANPFPFVADDSLFYVVIGRNIADGHGITFSRVMPTNGFQPLWQGVVAVLVTLGQAVGIDSDAAQLRLVIVTCWVLLAVAMWLLDRLLVDAEVDPIARFAAAATVLIVFGGPYGTLATEANLVLVLVAASLLAARRALASTRSGGDGPTARSAAALGVALGLLLLARLDTAFVAAVVLVMVLAAFVRRGEAAAGLRSTVLAGLVTTAVVTPYLVWNQVTFDHLLPISGAVKLRVGTFSWVSESVGRDGWGLLAGAALLGAVGWLIARRPPLPWAWATALLGAAVTSGFYFAFSTGQLTRAGWYHAPHLAALTLAVALLLDRVVPGRLVLGRIAIAAVLVALAGSLVFNLEHRSQGANDQQAREVLAFGRAAGAALPPDAVVVTVDYPGYVALVTRRPTIALDGLTGSFAFQDDLRDHGGPCTLHRLGATHLVTAGGRLQPAPGAPGTSRQEVTSWLHDAQTGDLTVTERQLVVPDRGSGLELWRISPRCP